MKSVDTLGGWSYDLQIHTLRERLAELEHEQWIEWSRSVAEREPLSAERIARWEKYWVPYAMLDEEVKDQDRRYADRIIALLVESAA